MDEGRKSTKYTLEPFTIFELLGGGSKCNLHKQEQKQIDDFGQRPQYKDMNTTHFAWA